MGWRGLVWLGAVASGVALSASCGLMVDVPEAAEVGPPSDVGGGGSGGTGGDVDAGGGDAGGGTMAQGGAGPCGALTLCEGECVDVMEDAGHCGVCGHGCLGAACSGGFCEREVIVSGMANAGWDIVLTANELVWSGEPVMRAPLANLAGAGALLARAPDLCLLDTDIFAMDAGEIMRVSLGGVGSEMLFISVGPNARAIAANKGSVFWLDDAGLHRVDANDQSTAEIIDPVPVPSSLQIGADATYAYVASPGPGPGLWRIHLQTNERTQLVSSQVARFAIDEAAGMIYFTSNSAVRAVSSDGLVPQIELIDGQGVARGIAVDASHVYWVDQQAGTLNRIGKGGAGHLVLAESLSTPVGVAVDATHAYVTESASGTMSRVAK